MKRRDNCLFLQPLTWNSATKTIRRWLNASSRPSSIYGPIWPPESPKSSCPPWNRSKWTSCRSRWRRARTGTRSPWKTSISSARATSPCRKWGKFLRISRQFADERVSDWRRTGNLSKPSSIFHYCELIRDIKAAVCWLSCQPPGTGPWRDSLVAN